MTPETLVAGPRGRRFLLAYAMESESSILEDSAHHPLAYAVFHASMDLEPATTARYTTSAHLAGEPVAEPATLTPSDVAERLAATSDPAPTPERLLHCLTRAVDAARYWQEPDGDDALAAVPVVTEQLARRAGPVLDSPHVSWWTEGFAPDRQRRVRWEGLGNRRSADARKRLAGWHREITASERRAARERPADPDALVSGEWWSTPPGDLVHTTRELAGFGPCGLWLVEDGLGWENATTAAVRPTTDPRVYEVDHAGDWAALCREHPIDVTAQKRHDWYRATGRVGPWVVPDWNAVAREYDAVHLTVAAYLAAAGTAIDVDDETAGVIAGWNPDETYWLTDAVVESAETTSWTYTDEDTWRPLRR